MIYIYDGQPLYYHPFILDFKINVIAFPSLEFLKWQEDTVYESPKRFSVLGHLSREEPCWACFYYFYLGKKKNKNSLHTENFTSTVIYSWGANRPQLWNLKSDPLLPFSSANPCTIPLFIHSTNIYWISVRSLGYNNNKRQIPCPHGAHIPVGKEKQ